MSPKTTKVMKAKKSLNGHPEEVSYGTGPLEKMFFKDSGEMKVPCLWLHEFYMKLIRKRDD